MLEQTIIATLASATCFMLWLHFIHAPARRSVEAVPEEPAKLETAREPVPAQTGHHERIAALEEELCSTQKQAAEANTSRTTFLTNVSHEIRTPMNGVIGFTELLLASDMSGDQRKQVELIAESGRSMLRLLNDIIEVAKIEGGQMRLVVQETDLRQDLRHCSGLMEPIARSKGLGWSLHIDEKLPDIVALDRMRLRQVILNLIGNAVKFTQDGQIEIDARMTKSADSAQLVISIIDSGPGIPKEFQKTIFSPFAQDDGGSGFGLNISDQIIQMMGGKIAIDSMPGLGSTFTITLPLSATPAEQEQCAEHPQAISNPSAIVEREPAGCRVLIAEDHEINQHLIMAMAKSLGMDAHLAKNGREAVEAVIHAEDAGKPFDIVLMDMQMPEMDGMEATKHLRNIGFAAKILPIVALTANCFPEDISACREAGMQSHLAKPVTLDSLSREVMAQMGDMRHRKIAANDVTDGADCDLLRQGGNVSPNIHQLEDKYRQRKTRLLDQIGHSLEKTANDTDWELLTTQLHKLAGVAANFGDVELGEMSRKLEKQLKQLARPDMRMQVLAREWPRLKRAA